MQQVLLLASQFTADVNVGDGDLFAGCDVPGSVEKRLVVLFAACHRVGTAVVVDPRSSWPDGVVSFRRAYAICLVNIKEILFEHDAGRLGRLVLA